MEYHCQPEALQNAWYEDEPATENGTKETILVLHCENSIKHFPIH